MKKKRIIISSIIMLLAIVVLIITSAIEGSGPVGSWTLPIGISNGAADTDISNVTLGIEGDGKYIIKSEISCDEAPGFLIGCRLLDADGNQLHSFTANTGKIESEVLELKKGEYTLEYSVLAKAEETEAFVSKYIGDEKNYFDDYRDGSWELNLLVRVLYARSNSKAIAVVMGFIIGLCIAVIILTAVKKGDNKKAVYDERQLAIRGEGYKYAFFTLIGYVALMLCIDASAIELPIESSVIYAIAILVGAAVFATHAIWKDAYYALNQRRKGMNIVFAILAASNLFFGISAYLDENSGFFVNGKLGFRSVNLFCGILFLYIFVVMIAKSIADKKENADEEFEA